MDKFSELNLAVKPPFIATKLMSLLLPKRFLDNVIGDLEEEFSQRVEQDVKAAKRWYWQQSMATSSIYLQKKLGSVEVLGRLNFYLPLALFLVVISLVSLLSSMDDPEFISATFWQELMQGKLHTALFSENFWHNFWGFIKTSELSMLLHFESFVLSAVNLLALLYLYKNPNTSALKLACWGYALAIIPYFWSFIYLSSHSLQPKQIGPIIALTLLNLLYMLLPVSALIHRKLMSQKQAQRQFEQEMINQEQNSGH